jgi:hypothetical protein
MYTRDSRCCIAPSVRRSGALGRPKAGVRARRRDGVDHANVIGRTRVKGGTVDNEHDRPRRRRMKRSRIALVATAVVALPMAAGGFMLQRREATDAGSPLRPGVRADRRRRRRLRGARRDVREGRPRPGEKPERPLRRPLLASGALELLAQLPRQLVWRRGDADRGSAGHVRGREGLPTYAGRGGRGTARRSYRVRERREHEGSQARRSLRTPNGNARVDRPRNVRARRRRPANRVQLHARGRAHSRPFRSR